MTPIQPYRNTSGPTFENLNTKQYHRGKVHTLHGMLTGKHHCDLHEVTQYENITGLVEGH